MRIYYDRIEELEKVRIPEVKEGIKEEALIALIEGHIKNLPIWVVLVNNLMVPRGIPETLYYIGQIGCGIRIFYKDANFYIGEVAIVDKEGPPILSAKMAKNAGEIGRAAVVKCLDFTLSQINDQFQPKMIVPKGYFLFKFRAQWAVGGYNDEEKTVIHVIQAASFEEAAKKIVYDYVASMHENHSWNFSVCFDSTGWRQLKIIGSVFPNSILREELWKGKITLEFCD